MKLNKLMHVENYLLLLSFLFIVSCEVDRSTIGVEHQVQYSYNYINDYDYINKRYFFVDSYYRDRYEMGFSDDLSTWSYEEGTQIRELNVYHTGFFPDIVLRKGVATISSRINEYKNLPNLDGIETHSGEVELGYFAPLKEGLDYHYNYAHGYFWLKRIIKPTEILAIAYRTDKDTVGTLQPMISDDDSTQFYVLRLIKPRTMREYHSEVWPLMMRNVYFLGDSNYVRDGFNLNIRKKDNKSTVQEIGMKRRFAHLLGLDLLDEYGSLIDEGDGQVDNNSYLYDLRNGILIFPGLHPFNPLPNSRFQIADTNRVKLYNTIDRVEMINSSKFEIVVQYIQN